MCKAHAYEYFPASGYGIFTVFPFAPCATKLLFPLSFFLSIYLESRALIVFF